MSKKTKLWFHRFKSYKLNGWKRSKGASFSDQEDSLKGIGETDITEANEDAFNNKATVSFVSIERRITMGRHEATTLSGERS